MDKTKGEAFLRDLNELCTRHHIALEIAGEVISFVSDDAVGILPYELGEFKHKLIPGFYLK